MNQFCEMKGIKRQFSIARTPQQNGVAERRNRTLIEAARTMLADSKSPTTFWAEVVNTACYVQNRVGYMNNLDTTIQVSPIPTTRIHKDHPLDQVIGAICYTNKKNVKECGGTWVC
ncbi:putative ribonuclease H-like domain-containing protein [Tanacetum coccineum]